MQQSYSRFYKHDADYKSASKMLNKYKNRYIMIVLEDLQHVVLTNLQRKVKQMETVKKVLAVVACACMAVSLTACGSKKSATYTKAGFGMTTSASANEDGSYQINTTMATVALDKDGKIAYVDLDVAQQNTNNADELRTKEEKKEDYGMLKASGIGKELYEQVAFLEESMIGLTADEVAALDNSEGTDLAAGCTITIDAYKAAVAKAFENMTDVEAEKIGAGEMISVDAEDGEVDTTVASVALDADGKVVWAYLDVAQTSNDSDVRSKKEKKEDYGMLKASAIGKEIYEQLAFFEETLIGKTADEVAALENGEGTDLATGCTIKIDAYKAALAEAFETAK